MTKPSQNILGTLHAGAFLNVAMMTWLYKANGGNINLVPQNTLMQPAGYISSTVQRKATLEP